MNQECVAQLIHEHTTAIAALEVRISTHEAIRRLRRVLALEEITLGQVLGILAEAAERSLDPEQQGLYQQAMDALRQMQTEEPGTRWCLLASSSAPPIRRPTVPAYPAASLA